MFTLDKSQRRLVKILLFILPFLIIFFFSRNILLKLSNPSWGDMTAMPSSPIPFSYLFYPWQDIYDGIFGGQYMPHFLFSYLVPFISSTILEYAYLFLLFPVIFFSFLDFFKVILKKTSLFDIESLSYANILTLIIYFSNVFLVNFLQGNPDVYYPYLLCVPGILYLYLFVRYRQIDSVLKMSLIITLAMWVGFFALYYMGILLFPFFFLFTILLVRKDIKQVVMFLVILLSFVLLNNLPYIFMSLKPILSAVHRVTTDTASSGLLIEDFFSLYRAINPLNLLYFAGNAGDYTWLLFSIPGGSISSHNPVYPFLSFQFIAIIVGFFLGLRGSTRFRDTRLLLYGILAIFLIIFTVLLVWDTELFFKLVNRIPLIPLFRNPKKLILSLFVAYMIFMVFLKLITSKKTYILLISTVLILNFSAVLPLISDGYSGLENAYKTSLKTYGYDNARTLQSFSSYAGFPTRFLNLRAILKEEDNTDQKYHYRVVVVPDSSQQLYGSQVRYLFSPFFISPLQAVWGNLDQRVNVLESFYNTLLGKNLGNSAQVLKIMNVKYLVIDRKSPYYLFTKDSTPQTRSYYGTFTIGDPEKFYKIIKNNKNFKLISDDENFYIFKVTNFNDNSLFIPQQPCLIQQVNSKSCDFVATDPKYLNTDKSVIISNQTFNNPTSYSVTMKTISPTTATLFFSQSFDDAWKISQKGGGDAKILDHTVGSLFGNAWQVHFPRPGPYKFEIEYTWQKSYAVMIIVSIVAIGINVLLLLTYPLWKKKLK